MISYIEGVVENIEEKGVLKEIPIETSDGIKIEKVVFLENIISIKDNESVIHNITLNNNQISLSSGDKVFVFYENDVAKEMYRSESAVIERMKEYSSSNDLLNQEQKKGVASTVGDILFTGVACFTASNLFITLPFFIINRFIFNVNLLNDFFNNYSYFIYAGSGIIFFLLAFAYCLSLESKEKKEYKKIYLTYKEKNKNKDVSLHVDEIKESVIYSK